MYHNLAIRVLRHHVIDEQFDVVLSATTMGGSYLLLGMAIAADSRERHRPDSHLVYLLSSSSLVQEVPANFHFACLAR
ncbi:uncharacterized protein ARMOST_08388 [Armillaria ostoyae]|uniref:Uncharacterized protein n=1 Tax=Armillaria ostoyae TaxID=47428 RepID=A0A284R8F2_ARMOS|nr:uncharacterized protein ARMOST_08388 [Armillaria ostoyae]